MAFVDQAEDGWRWVKGVTHHYRGFHGGLGDTLHNALWPAAVAYSAPEAAGV